MINVDEAKISAVFSSLGLSLVDRGVSEITEAKKQMAKHLGLSKQESCYRVIVSNGTGLSKKYNAKLERST